MPSDAAIHDQTNRCIYLVKNQPEQVARRFAKCFVGDVAMWRCGDVAMSAITYAELEYGVTVSAGRTRERRNLAALVEDIPVVPFDAAAASAYGPIREATRERKKDQLDKLIAAHSLALGVVLVTNNERDFASYPGVRLENWLNA